MYLIRAGICCLLFLGLGSSAAFAGPQLALASQLYDEAYAAHTASPPDTNKALSLYLRVLELEPELYGPLLKAGMLYLGKGQYRKAKSLFGQAVRSARQYHADKPAYEAEASNALGVCYQKEGRLEEAGKWFRAALKVNPQLVEANFNLVNLYMALKEEEKALAALARAEEQAPSRRYDIIKGRIKGKEGGSLWNPMWLKVVVAGIGGGLVIFLLLRRLRVGKTA